MIHRQPMDSSCRGDDIIPEIIEWIAVRLAWFIAGMFAGYLWFFTAFGMTITITGG